MWNDLRSCWDSCFGWELGTGPSLEGLRPELLLLGCLAWLSLCHEKLLWKLMF